MMKDEMNSRPVEILLVEDNQGDVRLTLEAFKECKIKNKIHLASNGIEALEFLRKKGSFLNAPSPDLVILDLNLPLKDGREVLAEIKSDDVLKRIPVVVMTTSNAEEDVVKAYDLHANCYITKPMDFEKFTKIVMAIEGFWFTIVRLPHEE